MIAPETVFTVSPHIVIEKLPLFLSLKNRIPSFINKKSFDTKKQSIFQEFSNLEPGRQQNIQEIFSRFVYDPGAKDDYHLKNEEYERLRQVDPTFNEKTKSGVKIYNKKTLLSRAEAAILSGKKVAFVKFDINYLRLIDKAGYADFTIRDLSFVMNSVAERYQDKDIIASRTGGDSFCFFLSSDKDIDQKLLEKLHKEVIEEFSKKTAFYKIDEPADVIVKSKTRIKNELDQIVLANKKDHLRKIFRTLTSGKIPDIKDIDGQNISNDEYSKLRATIEKRHSAHSPLNNKKNLDKLLESLIDNHPELTEQTDLLTELIKSGKNNLSEYLLSFLESYYIDPLLNEQVLEGPDFFKLLQARKQLEGERVIYVYFPWLKNMNSDLGEKAVDEEIQGIYKKICEQSFNQKQGDNKLPRARKDGADFIFLSNEYQEGGIIEVELKNDNLNSPFKEKIPAFLVTVDYPTGSSNLSQVIDGMKNIGRVGFVNWLNKLYELDSNRASIIVDYYLKDRKEDRCRELLLTIDSMLGISEGLINTLDNQLKKVAGENKKKLYTEFGITQEEEVL